MQQSTKDKLKKAAPIALGSSMLVLSMMPAAAAFAANNYITNVTTTANGTSVKATSNTNPKGLHVWYQFRATTPQGHTWILRKFEAGNTFTWTPPQAGNYTVQAFALTQYQVGTKQWNKAIAGTTTTDTRNVVSSLSISGAPTANIATNTSETLGVVAKTSSGTVVTNPGTPTWSLPSGTTGATIQTLTNGGVVFDATAAGSYTVTATLDGQTATSTIVVYGAPAAVKLSAASSSLVADGAATDTITATVVDANGNTVGNYSGTATISDTSGLIGAANTAGNQPSDVTDTNGTYTVQFTNGVATFAIGDTLAVNSTDFLTATSSDSSIKSGTTSVTTTAPVATSVGFVTPPKAINDTAGVDSTVNLAVLDQLGNPMPSGAYTATVTLSGPATLGNGTSTETVGLAPQGSITIDPTGQVGTLTLSASVSGLTSGSASIALAAPGTATQLSGTATQTTDYTANAAGAFSTYQIGTVQVEDANGLNVASPSSTPTATVTYNGSATSNFTATASTPSATGAFNVDVSYAGTSTLPVGTYDVNVTDGTLSTTIPFTVTAGAAAAIQMVPSAATDVLSSNPNTVVTAQVVDSYGNPVADSGAPVTFTSSSTSDITLSGGTGTSGSEVVDTNASGMASINADVLASGGTVTATSGSLTSGTSGALNLVGAYATSVKAIVTYATGASSYVAGSDTGLTITGEALDSSGNVINNDALSTTITGPGGYDQTVSITSPGIANLSGIYPTAPGTYSVTMKDVSAPGQPSTTTSFVVTAGALAGFALLDASGTDLSLSTTGDTIDAGTKAALTLSSVDGAGNPVASDATYTVTLPTLSTAGGVYWEDAAGNPISTVTFTSGEASVPVYVANATSSAITVNDATQSGTNVDAAYASGSSAAQLEAAPAGTLTLTATDLASGTLTTTAGASTLVTANVANGSTELANQTVVITIGSADGTVSSTAVTTNAAGDATFTYVAPTTSGSYSFTAQVGALGTPSTVNVKDNAAVAAPTGVTGTETAAGINLSWTAPSGTTPSSYVVEEAVNGGGTYSAVSSTDLSSTGTTSAAIKGLIAGDSYTFEVKAVDAYGNDSAASSASTAVEYGMTATSIAASSTAQTVTITLNKAPASAGAIADYTVKQAGVAITATSIAYSATNKTITLTFAASTIVSSDPVTLTATSPTATDTAGAPLAPITTALSTTAS